MRSEVPSSLVVSFSPTKVSPRSSLLLGISTSLFHWKSPWPDEYPWLDLPFTRRLAGERRVAEANQKSVPHSSSLTRARHRATRAHPAVRVQSTLFIPHDPSFFLFSVEYLGNGCKGITWYGIYVVVTEVAGYSSVFTALCMHTYLCFLCDVILCCCYGDY